MEREPVPGECVVVTANNGDHPSRIGDRFIVHHVDDSDATIKGVLQGSRCIADFWIPWSDLEPVRFDWQYARRHLPADVVELLSACDGIQFLSLNRQVKEVLVDSLPDWKARVMAAIQRIDTDSADDFDA